MRASGPGLIYGAMMRRSAETVVLADHTKFDRPSLSVYGPWSPQVLLVCDEAPEGELLSAIETRRCAHTALLEEGH